MSVITKRGEITPGTFLGDLVAWDFATNEGFGAPRDELRRTFLKHGFDGCILDSEGDPSAAIRRATIAVPKHGLVVQQLARPKKDTPVALAVYKKEAADGEVGDPLQPGARVRHDAVLGRVVALPLEGQREADPDCLGVAEAIANLANRMMGEVTNKELSRALVTAGGKAMWAPYRRMGGAYFVFDSPARERMRALLVALGNLPGFRPNITPLSADADGHIAANVRYAAEMAIDAELEELRADLERAADDRMRESTIEDRILRCQGLMLRAKLYSSVLTDKLDSINEQVDKLKSKFEEALSSGVDAGDEGAFAEIDSLLAEPKKPAKRSTKKPAEKSSPVEDISDDNLFSV